MAKATIMRVCSYLLSGGAAGSPDYVITFLIDISRIGADLAFKLDGANDFSHER